MTQLNLGTSSIFAHATLQETRTKPSLRKRVTIALLLSLLAPGLGQVYGRRPWRGLAMSLTLSIMILATGELRLLVTFVGLVGSLLIVILWRLLVIGDACFLAWKQASVDLSSRTSRVKSVLVGVTILLLGTYPGPDFLLKRWAYFRAYKISSESMCPTLCVGDRVVAEMDGFRTRSPERGELIVFDHERRGVMFIKRVVGIGGDTVVYGPGNTVSVDGQATHATRCVWEATNGKRSCA